MDDCIELRDITADDYAELTRLADEIEERLSELTCTRGIAIAKTKADELRMWLGFAYFKE